MAKKITNLEIPLGLGTLLGEAISDDFDFNPESGYIRFINGLQISWIKKVFSAGGNAWQNLYYSDHTMGNWKKPFDSIIFAKSFLRTTTYWSTENSWTKDIGGTVRVFRPTNGVDSIEIGVFAIGTWK